MRLVVLYGSQTGTAQDVAEQIWRESRSWGFKGPVLTMDEYPTDQLIEESLVVFVVATTGNGDEPDNMRQSWKFLLRRTLSPTSLQNLHFACLGLGDSSYVKYNYAAKKLNKRLQLLGANVLIPLGLCDDQHDHGLSAVALPWIEQLWKVLSTRLPIRRQASCSDAVFKWNVNVLEQRSGGPPMHSLQWPLPGTCTEFTVRENSRTTTSDHFQDVRLLRLEFAGDLNWSPSDVLQVRPCNSDAQVAAFFELVAEHNLDFTPHTIVQLSTNHEDIPLPLAYQQPLTLHELAKYIWDFSSKPRQRAFELLAIDCVDELEKEKLLEFTTAEGLDDLINYINRPRRTILEVLQDFRHATSKLKLQTLFEMLPIIQTRSFSIASVPSTKSLDLLVAVVEYKTKLSTPRLGLCSNWLKALSRGDQIVGLCKPGTMALPRDATTPIIMVGPGTGIAPFRSIIQSRAHDRDNGVPVGPMVVFFGCRSHNKDFHFSEDFAQWQSTQLIKAYFAFSRDQDYKIYVQHLITESKTELEDLIRIRNATILVAGSSKNMPKEVREAFIHVLGDEGYVDDMVKSKRYQEETWA